MSIVEIPKISTKEVFRVLFVKIYSSIVFYRDFERIGLFDNQYNRLTLTLLGNPNAFFGHNIGFVGVLCPLTARLFEDFVSESEIHSFLDSLDNHWRYEVEKTQDFRSMLRARMTSFLISKHKERESAELFSAIVFGFDSTLI